MACDYCLLSLSQQTKLSNHYKTCIVLKLFNTPKEKIDKALNTYNELLKSYENVLELKEKLEKKVKILEDSLFKAQKQNSDMNKALGNNDIFNPPDNLVLSNIQEADLAKSTKENYAGTWRSFSKWCGKKRKLKCEASANDYIKDCINSNLSIETVKKTRRNLQATMKGINGPKFCLRKIRSNKIPKRQKIFIPAPLLQEFLKKIKYKSPSAYIAVLLQSELGSRINAVANIKIEDILFLNNPDSLEIRTFDSKTMKYSIKSVSQGVCNEIKEYLNNFKRNDFLFQIKERRSHLLRQKVNRFLKSFCKDKKCVPFTSHDIRRYYACNLAEQITKKIVNEVKEKMEHSRPEITINHYLPNGILEEVKKCLICGLIVKRSCLCSINNELRPESKNSIEIKDKIISQFIHIRKSEHYEEDEIIKFYETRFTAFNDVMTTWVKKYSTLIYVSGKDEDELIEGAITYKKLKIKKLNVTEILLIASDTQGKGIGKSLISFLKQTETKIVLWGDLNAVGFFYKLNFICDEKIGKKLEKYMPKCHYSSFFYILEDSDIDAINNLT